MSLQTGAGSGQVAVSFTALRRLRKEKLDEAVKRMSESKGVLGIMVTTEDWDVIQSTFHHNLTYYFKRHMKVVEHLAMSATRDTDPTNELHFMRIQCLRFEILLSVANDHRLLIVYSSVDQLMTSNPLKVCVESVKQIKRDKMMLKRQGKGVRMVMDTCRPHTTIIGGKDKVIITERIGDTILDQRDDVNNQTNFSGVLI